MMTMTVTQAFKIVSFADANLKINSFQNCSDIIDSLKTERMIRIRAIVIIIYSLTEIIYSIVILRLFVSNGLKLSLWCKLLPIDAMNSVS